MTKKLTNEIFVKKVFNLVKDEYTFLENYVNASIKILVRHNICNTEYLVTPNKFLMGRRCPNCCLGTKMKDRENIFALIEYQGLQHVQSIEFFGGLDKFYMLKSHDAYKKWYCLVKNYKFIEIFYKDFDQIEKILESELTPLLRKEECMV